MSETAATLEQKFLELRKVLPRIQKEKHSDAVSYKFAKIDDVWREITPKMNELGVNFCVSREENAQCTNISTSTRNGERLMFIYHSDLTIIWTNTDAPEDTETAVIHAVGWNDDPAKAKGCAHTYALKYYLFEKFSVDMSDSDPDTLDNSAKSATPAAGGYQSHKTTNSSKGSSYVYSFGKYKGQSIEQVEQADSSYNDWILNSEKGRPEVKNAIIFFRKKHSQKTVSPSTDYDYPPPPPEYV